MEPNFYDKEYLIIDEITYRFHEPQRGDIIVFRYPRNPQEYFIKRLIGLPGETIQIKDGHVYIFNKDNPGGFMLSEDYLPDNNETEGSGEKIKLGENEYFVLGDNRRASKDSRYFGPLDRSFITGRVFFRGWPFDRLQVFHSPIYN